MAECPNGHPNADDQKFCGECGEPISPGGADPAEGQNTPDATAPTETALPSGGASPNGVPWFRQPTALVLGGLALIVVVAIVVALSSGGGSNNAQSSGSNSSSNAPATDTPTSVDTTPVTAAGLSQPVGTWTVKGTYASGYTATTTLQLGAPKRSSGSELSGACAFAQQNDAVIPARLQITNTTSNFSISPGVSLIPSLQHHPGELGLAGDFRLTSGPTCDDPKNVADPVLSVSWQSVGPGQSVSQDFFLILRNYFTPNTPGGDSAGYRATYIQPRPGQDVGGTIEGPGVIYPPVPAGIAFDRTAVQIPISGSS